MDEDYKSLRLHGDRIFFPKGLSHEVMEAALTKEYSLNIGEVSPQDNRSWHEAGMEGTIIWAVASIVLGVLAYAISWALGWIVSGFAGDNDAAAK